MKKESNLGFRGSIVNGCKSLWWPEILSGAVLFICASIIFSGLFGVDRLVIEKTVNFQERLAFIKYYGALRKRAYPFLRQKKSADISEVIYGIESLAQKNGVIINNFKAGLEETGNEKDISVLPVELNCIVPQKAIIFFVSGLRDLDFLCRIISLSIKPDPAQDGLLHLSMKIERVRLLSSVKWEVIMKSAGGFDLITKPLRTTASINNNIFRNIIKPVRRVVSADLPVQEVFNPADYKLVGIVYDGQSKAVLENIRSAGNYYLSEGDQIGAMVVKRIAAQEVVLEKENQRYIMAL